MTLPPKFLAFATLSLLAACGGGDDATDTDTPADTDAAAAVFPATLAGDDVATEVWYKYETVWTGGTVLADEFNATVTFTAGLEGSDPDCTRTLALRGTVGTCSTDACDWRWDVDATVSAETGTCPELGGSGEYRFLPSLNGPAYFAHYTDYTFNDTAYGSLLQFAYATDADGTEWEYIDWAWTIDDSTTYLEGYDPETGAVSGLSENLKESVPAVDYDYSECADSAVTVESPTSHIGSTAVTGSVTCEGEQPTYADIYTFEVTAAGTAFSASVDTTADADMAMTLISPSGCPVAESEAGITCTGGGDCPSAEETLDEVGAWSVAVEAAWGCSGESVPYTFDMQLGGS